MMDRFKMCIPSFLVVALTLMVVAIIHVLLWHELPASNKEIVYTSLGIILGKFGSIVDYHFGSSSGSTKKDDAMIATIKSANDTTANIAAKE